MQVYVEEKVRAQEEATAAHAAAKKARRHSEAAMGKPLEEEKPETSCSWKKEARKKARMDRVRHNLEGRQKALQATCTEIFAEKVKIIRTLARRRRVRSGRSQRLSSQSEGKPGGENCQQRERGCMGPQGRSGAKGSCHRVVKLRDPGG